MKIPILLTIAVLIFNQIAQAQDYTGTWHLTKIIQDDDTLNVNFEENFDCMDELTVYPQKSSSDTLICILFENVEDVKQLERIARNQYIIKSFDPETFEEKYIINASDCHFSHSLKEPNLWFQICEGQITLFKVELKNEQLYLIGLSRKILIEKDIEQEIYIYERGKINIPDDN